MTAFSLHFLFRNMYLFQEMFVKKIEHIFETRRILPLSDYLLSFSDLLVGAEVQIKVKVAEAASAGGLAGAVVGRQGELIIPNRPPPPVLHPCTPPLHPNPWTPAKGQWPQGCHSACHLSELRN